MVMDLKWLDHLELLDYNLPNDFIALHPVSPRDHSRLLYYNHGDMSDFQFTHLVRQFSKIIGGEEGNHSSYQINHGCL